ncbi:unnamed protein product [Rotaria sordida]|uniref:Integrase catalytic domain-containing protein n=1 Tax=Rotaria sordida TaxID=392033 RepID=A0A815QMH0_9BILA|nr:unnamed protein product [Rotaria sordida]CAF1464031.1 unnamed protein product [Rotaria sordida]CAF3982644.1 unnamed protein product [Rotaria sordida]CAF4010028.1 unnamed protein product [Rotaria sordida]
MMASLVAAPNKIHKGKSIKKKTDISSQLTSTVSSTNPYSSTTTTTTSSSSIKYANITEKRVTLFISGCHVCKLKRTKPKISSKSVIRPIISNDFNARDQIYLIDMQSCPDGHFKFILNYQDHVTKFCIVRSLKTKTAAEVALHLLDLFTIFGAPIILQSDNGREFVAKIIEELFNMILEHTPYSRLFGNEPKVGLTSTSLHPSIFDSINSEEELQNELNSAAIDTNLFDEDRCDYEEENSANYYRQNDSTQNNSDEDDNGHDHTQQDDEQNDNEQDNQRLDKINNDKFSPLNNRIKRTNAVRQVAREGQKIDVKLP